MLMDLDALAYVLGTKVVIREKSDDRNRRYYICDLKGCEIVIGRSRSILIPASSGNRTRWRSVRTARDACARNLRGRTLRYLRGLHHPETDYFRAPDELVG